MEEGWVKEIKGIRVCSADIISTLYQLLPGIESHILSQSHIPGKNAALFLLLKPFTQNKFSFHLGAITARWPCGFKACPRLLHIAGPEGIEPRDPIYRVQCLNTRPRALRISDGALII